MLLASLVSRLHIDDISLSVHHFGPDVNVSNTGWTDMNVCTDIHDTSFDLSTKKTSTATGSIDIKAPADVYVSQRKSSNDFGDPLTGEWNMFTTNGHHEIWC